MSAPYFPAGCNSILLTKISAPSDWMMIFPEVNVDRMPSATTFPLTMLVMRSPWAITSRRVHSP